MAICTHCGSNNIEYDSTQGNLVCHSCGTVLEENTVVSEITFGDNAATGTQTLIGQFVSSDKGRSAIPMVFGRRQAIGGIGGASESREQTIYNGRKKIQAMAAAVKLNEHHVDMAQRWFVLALQHQFTRGRKSASIVAACLYIVCRQERTPHMLLDFADILQINVYSIGHVFLRLVRLLNLDIPLIDPSFYVGRFAARMELAEKTQVVANTALRLVARMKRDWIQTGRRPAGICGASLIIAARMHGFRRTEKELMMIVHVCEATLKKRLAEFGETKSSQLTPGEFEGLWLEEEGNPPAYDAALRQRIRKGMPKATLKVLADAFPEEYKLSGVENGNEEDIDFPPTPASQPLPVPLPRTPIFPEKETLSDIEDDDDINGIFLTPKEMEIKTRIWIALNGDYVNQAEAKRQREAEEETAKEASRERSDVMEDIEEEGSPTKGKDEETDGQIFSGKPLSSKKVVVIRRRARAPKPRDHSRTNLSSNMPHETAAEAAKQMLVSRKLSRKINYDALDELFSASSAVKERKSITSQ